MFLRKSNNKNFLNFLERNFVKIYFYYFLGIFIYFNFFSIDILIDF
jgi:hypothetical protein